MDLKLDLGFGSVTKKEKLNENTLYDMLIIGTGPAGLNAALYAKRKGLEVGVFTSKQGGQVADTSIVENYLGITDISGEALVQQFVAHVNQLKVPVLQDTFVNKIIQNDNGFFELSVSGDRHFKTKTLVVATGSNPRKLGVPGEESLTGKGVSYCAICDGPLFQDLDVIVSGGGNSAVEAAIDLSKVARKVTIVHRSKLRADQIVIDKMDSIDNIDLLIETQILEVLGDNKVSGVRAKDKNTGEEKVIEAQGVFIEIGYLPNNELVKSLVKLNDHGEIIVNSKNETNVGGIFAAGDVTDVPYKQIVISASEGAKAALSANDYLNKLQNDNA